VHTLIALVLEKNKKLHWPAQNNFVMSLWILIRNLNSLWLKPCDVVLSRSIPFLIIIIKLFSLDEDPNKSFSCTRIFLKKTKKPPPSDWIEVLKDEIGLAFN
jgi:hypothetical protein